MLTVCKCVENLRREKSNPLTSACVSDLPQAEWCPFHLLQKCQRPDIHVSDTGAVLHLEGWASASQRFLYSGTGLHEKVCGELFCVPCVLSWARNYTAELAKASCKCVIGPGPGLAENQPAACQLPIHFYMQGLLCFNTNEQFLRFIRETLWSTTPLTVEFDRGKQPSFNNCLDSHKA